ncbi:MAG: BRO family protein [Nanoarchaeota archaeon]
MGNDELMHIAIFNGEAIRRKLIGDKWFFSVVDVVGVLTESDKPRDYWYRLKVRELEGSGIELSTFCRQLKLIAEDGKERETDCADIEGMFRIIQSISSKKAEPFKRWLARVGYERVQEIENPELAQERMKDIYEKKGYSKEWIDKRLRGIAVRQDLTDEWKKRGVKEKIEFAILTNEISKAAFGLDINEYKKIKGLNDENLRDHMTDLELIFNMLGEASTAEIERKQDPQEFDEHILVSRKGGEIARIAKEKLEEETGESIVSDENYLDVPETKENLQGFSGPQKSKISAEFKKKKKRVLVEKEIVV